MNTVVVAKFGGSVIGIDGISIPVIIQRINFLSRDAKVVAVFSAPLTVVEAKRRSLTDVALELGKRAEEGKAFDLIFSYVFLKIIKSNAYPSSALFPSSNATSVNDLRFSSTTVKGAEKTATTLASLLRELIL